MVNKTPSFRREGGRGDNGQANDDIHKKGGRIAADRQGHGPEPPKQEKTKKGQETGKTSREGVTQTWKGRGAGAERWNRKRGKGRKGRRGREGGREGHTEEERPFNQVSKSISSRGCREDLEDESEDAIGDLTTE